MFGILDLTWKPSASQTSPPAGKASAIVRDDPYEHTLRVTDGWLDGLGTDEWYAQLRRARLTSSTAGDPVADFDVDTLQDADDLLVILSLTAEVTADLPPSTVDLFWDLQSVDGGTLLAGKAKVLDDVSRRSGS